MPRFRLELPGLWYEMGGLPASLRLLSANLLSLSLSLALFWLCVVRSANGILCATTWTHVEENKNRPARFPSRITTLLSSSLVSSFSLVSSTSHVHMVIRVRVDLSVSVSRSGFGSSRCTFWVILLLNVESRCDCSKIVDSDSEVWSKQS
jgi:hypothetical protein